MKVDNIWYKHVYSESGPNHLTSLEKFINNTFVSCKSTEATKVQSVMFNQREQRFPKPPDVRSYVGPVVLNLMFNTWPVQPESSLNPATVMHWPHYTRHKLSTFSANQVPQVPPAAHQFQFDSLTSLRTKRALKTTTYLLGLEQEK